MGRWGFFNWSGSCGNGMGFNTKGSISKGLAMKSVWLKEDGEEGSDKNQANRQNSGSSAKGLVKKVRFREKIDPILDYQIRHLSRSFSDHCLLLISTIYEDRRRLEKRFKFEAWKANKELLNSKLAKLLEEERNDENLAELIDTIVELNFEIDKDERYWEQRARINWLKLGDKNTAFFHGQATQRIRKNCIRKLQKKRELQPYLSGIDRCIFEEDNLKLKASYTKEEIKVVLKEMGPTKALGEDGFPALFYQKCWPIIGEDVMSYCLHLLNEGMNLTPINKTRTVLIPKITSPTNISQFYLISLCNVLYKLIAKVITNRLWVVIEKCIDVAQSAFVPGRLIFDNVILAYELLHTLKHKRVGKKGFMAVKLDISKAYDRVEWNFVEMVMKKLGFDSNWVNSLMKCVTTVSYSVVFNGFTGCTFIPSRGLRQGDPLSPFLFLFCREGLSSLIRLALKEKALRGVKASRSGPQVSHLLFADDCILFGKATGKGVSLLKQILHEYEGCLGQKVNYSKSTIFFSANTQERDIRGINRILRVQCSNDPKLYLGLPNLVGRKKNAFFQNLKDRLQQRIDN
ncbi:hypothetical protein J1N35_018176 [Gossypium stocksii]|uniref:Reverse transcriptase domain-containing protein n=1 Tax=Gossypium stocksii TaxID=47602 RepID=A0A9D3VNS2_9ROSI|nr:hypothetical protein J1N35_018176 [Gossypium stocksii]